MADLDALMTSARTGEDSKDSWGSPIWLVDLLDKQFHFTLDAAATAENTKCDRYFDRESNGLAQSWENETVWLNCPYSTSSLWYKKAWSEATLGHATTVMLVPARTDTKSWFSYAIKGDIRFLKGRLMFTLSEEQKEIVKLKNIERKKLGKKPLDPEKTSAPFPSALVIFHKDIQLRTPSVIFWEVKEPK